MPRYEQQLGQAKTLPESLPAVNSCGTGLN